MGDSNRLSEEEDRAWRTFLHTSTRLMAKLEEELKAAHGETLANFDVLSNLSEAEGQRLRMSDLADRTLFSRSRLSYTVDSLQSRGLVLREPDPNDGRGVYAILTPEGRRLHSRLAPTHVAGIRRHFLSGMTPSAMHQTVVALTPVLENLE